MVFWLLAIAVTAIACAALYYAAAGRTVNAASGVGDVATESHFRRQLSELAADLDAGRLLPDQGEAARRELAREYMRAEKEFRPRSTSADRFGRVALLPIGAAVAIAFATYIYLGHPEMPAQPIADRPEAAAQNVDLGTAVAAVEQRLKEAPDDLRGWQVVAPAYLQLGRFADAATAFRRILELAPPTADGNVDLAEALLMANGGAMAGEPLDRLNAALAIDPSNVRARFYLAADATQSGRFDDAKRQWTELLALAKGDEPWVAAARQGLAAAEAGPGGTPAAMPDETAIRGMVEGLSQRLMASGGTIAEWTQLVRSRLVLKDTVAAQAAYDAAAAAYPDRTARAELDALAASGGLRVAAP